MMSALLSLLLVVGAFAVGGYLFLCLVGWAMHDPFPLSPYPLFEKMILKLSEPGAGREVKMIRFMRQAHRRICYADIRSMELDLYGKSFEHLGTPRRLGYDRSVYEPVSEAPDWREEFRLPDYRRTEWERSYDRHAVATSLRTLDRYEIDI